MRNLENAPRIYVGTYGQYNSGSLFGKWFDLTEYADLKEFLQDCFEFHRNELDPELMFQDWENILDFWYQNAAFTKKLSATLRLLVKWTTKLSKHSRFTVDRLTTGHPMGTNWMTNSKDSGKATADSLEDQ